MSGNAETADVEVNPAEMPLQELLLRGGVKQPHQPWVACCVIKCIIWTLVYVVIFVVGFCITHIVRGYHRGNVLYELGHAEACGTSAAGGAWCSVDIGFDLQPAEHLVFGLSMHQLAGNDTAIMREIVAGAPVRVADDDGALFNVLTNLPGAEDAGEYVDSYHNKYTFIDVPGRFVKRVVASNEDGVTEFQLEGPQWDKGYRAPFAAMRRFFDVCEHIILFGRAVGPLGTSKHNWWHPLSSNLTAAADVCPNACT